MTPGFRTTRHSRSNGAVARNRRWKFIGASATSATHVGWHAEIDPMNRRGRRAAELTAREREIADLIAEGKSNRKIAERLLLSQRTVETHVTSIFSKLEVSERGEVAGRVAQHR